MVVTVSAYVLCVHIITIGVSRDCIEVDPVGQSRSGRAFFSRSSQKPVSDSTILVQEYHVQCTMYILGWCTLCWHNF